jgi:transcriptional regulator with XRE-family HTH domain
MESMRETVCRNFKRIIEGSPLNAAEIARAAKVHESTVSRWKKGETVPEVDNLDEIAKILGVDVMEFYKREGNVATISPRTALKKYLVIPDDIIEDLSLFGEEAGVWEDIRAAILLEKKEQSRPNGKSGGE